MAFNFLLIFSFVATAQVFGVPLNDSIPATKGFLFGNGNHTAFVPNPILTSISNPVPKPIARRSVTELVMEITMTPTPMPFTAPPMMPLPSSLPTVVVNKAEVEVLKPLPAAVPVAVVNVPVVVPLNKSEPISMRVKREEYVVKPGDTLSKIAQTRGTTYTAIAEANKLTDPDMIFPGQKLTIPGESNNE